MSAKKKTLKPVTVGAVSVKLYQLGDGRVAFSDTFGGPRKVPKFADEATARAEAEKLIFKWLQGNRVREDLTSADLQAYQHAVVTCEQFQLPLSVAIDEYAHLRRLANGKDLVELVKAGSVILEVPQITVHGLCVDLMARKKRLGTKFYRVKELEYAQKLLADHGFTNRVISHVKTAELDSLLDKLEVGPRRRNNVRACLITLWRYARTKGYLTQALGETAAEKTDRSNEQRTTISIATPAAMRWWLENVKEEFMPWLAAVAFGGVRTEEIVPYSKNEKERLQWEDFRWTKGVIEIRPEVSKVNERRFCPITPNLAAWLAPYRNKTGPVMRVSARPNNETARLNKISEKLTRKGNHPVPGLKWQKNIHRHSFGSYRVAITKNMAQVEGEMGNSRPMMKRHYHDAREEDVAKEYFGIYPGGRPANLVDITAEGAGTDWNKISALIVPPQSHMDGSKEERAVG